MEISRGGPGKSRGYGNPDAFPAPPGSVPIPEYTPKPSPSDADRFQIAAWMVPAYANGNNLDGSWATVAWTSTRTFADTIAWAFLNNGHLIVQIWSEGELVNELSNV